MKPFWPSNTARQGGCWSKTWHNTSLVPPEIRYPEVFGWKYPSRIHEFHQAFDFLLVPRTMLPKRGSANKCSFGTWPQECKTVGVPSKTNILRLISLYVTTHFRCFSLFSDTEHSWTLTLIQKDVQNESVHASLAFFLSGTTLAPVEAPTIHWSSAAREKTKAYAGNTFFQSMSLRTISFHETEEKLC